MRFVLYSNTMLPFGVDYFFFSQMGKRSSRQKIVLFLKNVITVSERQVDGNKAAEPHVRGGGGGSSISRRYNDTSCLLHTKCRGKESNSSSAPSHVDADAP